KTQLAVFTLVSNYKNPIPIFLGASAALILVTLIGTVFGHLVTKYIPANYLQFGVGLLFLGIGIFVLKDALPDILSSFIK
ncbi:MAG: Ca2+/H+ antiporter, family, partial [Thermosediminibacterales bacterium]|nr:Ca2+/H+ antiporter, family [Thermosediminibacterales bacterium]